MNKAEWHVLIVEDEPDSADLALELLEQTGIRATIAGTAEDGMQLIKQWQPTAILIDLRLPGDDGWKMMQQLRAMRGMEDIPLLAMTAYHTPELARQALAEGFDMFFKKPIDAAAFAQQVQDAIEGKR